MTAKQVQIRRDTASNLLAATPAIGELAFNTTAKRLSVGDGLTAGGIMIPNYVDIQNSSFNYVVAGGTANAITLTPTPAAGSYSNLFMRMKAIANNTTSVAFNVSGLGSVTGKKMDGAALVNLEADDIVAGGIYDLFHNGTNIQVLNPGGSGGGGAGWELLSVASGGGSSYDFTSLITSEYNDYALILSSLIPGSDTTPMMRVSTNNGSSYDSGNNYDYAGSGRNNLGSSLGYNSTANSEIRLTAGSVAGGGNGVSGCIMLYDLNSSSVFKRFHGDLAYQAAGSGHLLSDVSFGGSYLSTSPVNAFTLLPAGGSWTSGKALLYGIKASL